MGHKSTMYCPNPIFLVDKDTTQEELDERVLGVYSLPEIREDGFFREVADTIEGEPVGVDDLYYVFKVSAGDVDLVTFNEENYAKHYGTELLAEIVSLVIPKGQRTWIEFVGDDDDRWGWAIEHGRTHELFHTEQVLLPSGKSPFLGDWLGEEGPADPEKTFRKLNIPGRGDHERRSIQ